jgi:hypothetical protein
MTARLATSILLVLWLAAAPAAGGDLKMTVKVVSPVAPSAVTVERDDDMQKHTLTRNPEGSYSGTLPAQDMAASRSSVVLPHRLVVSWSDNNNDDLFLGFRYPVPAQIDLSVYRDQSAYDEPALNAVDRLGTDLDSLLKKYFRARTFHRHWRFDASLPENYLAIRSARIWFDASTALSQRKNSPFRMDPEIVKLMRDYEQQARSPSGFARRYRIYVPAGYVEATLTQTAAADFAFVGLIPALVQAGKIEDARALNNAAMEALESAPADLRKAIGRHQGVNLDLLKGNAAVLN